MAESVVWWKFRSRAVCVAVVALALETALQAQNPPNLISMDDAVRIALAYNQTLRAQRLNVDQSKAEEITAGLKPNPTFSSIVDTIPLFSPQTIRLEHADLFRGAQLHGRTRRQA